ncbi:site-specific integrase, partial [Salmonella enterica subsp. enterica serovar Hadar]|uniref:site-specific integrase n=1 Tax=Salmonella enterica TaxID=28901 RepID=UPI0039EC8C9D
MADDVLPPALAWRAHLARDRRRSAHTVRAYAATAERLIAFLQGHWGERVDAAALARVTAADLRAFLAA